MQTDKQRWWCHSCYRSFSWSTGRTSYQRNFAWFRRWIVEGYTIRQLVHHSGHSRATIQRILHYWLERFPQPCLNNTQSQYLILDGTFLHRRSGMYAAMDGTTHQVVFGLYGINERPRDLLEFCLSLKRQGIEPKSATIDGNPHIFRTMQSLWPAIPIQRCLVHIQRQGLSWCRQSPKRTDAQRLRRIFLMVLDIHTHAQRQQFEKTFDRWNERYGQPLLQTTNRGWVTSDLQRARSMLMNAIPFMFSYLDDQKIPWSTNALEEYFARLKHRYWQHRGLSKRNRSNYFRWYFHLCPR